MPDLALQVSLVQGPSTPPFMCCRQALQRHTAHAAELALPLQELLAHNPEMKAGHSALELYIMAKRDNKDRWQKMADEGRQKWQAQAHGAPFHSVTDLWNRRCM